MNKQELLARVDHTLLKQDATWADIKALCDDALRYHTASVCIPPCYVHKAHEYLGERMPVCTVIGFPNGNHTTAIKVAEAKQAVADGAEEIDMVINIGMLRAGDKDYVREEIRAIKSAIGDKILKVIVECCLLTQEEKITVCRLVTDAGADYIKTSTGFSTGGATFEDVALMKANVGPNVKIKAAGGISSFEDAEKFVQLGADRLGTSRLVKLAKTEEA